MQAASVPDREGMVGMTHASTAITSDLDEAHPIDAGEAELTSANSAAELIGANCLADGPVGRVGDAEIDDAGPVR